MTSPPPPPPVSWAQQQTARFFRDRPSPTQAQCDATAKALLGGASTAVRPVASPGSMSYTVVCEGCCPGPAGPRRETAVVVSFREEGAELDEDMVRLARAIHGDGLVAAPLTFHGIMETADLVLLIYSMPFLRGSSCIDALAFEVDLDPEEEANHGVFATHLARYFARCWAHPQPVNPQARAKQQEAIRTRLARLVEEAPPYGLPDSVLSTLIDALPALFDSESYPQVLTHGDLSVTNILVDEDSLEITGVIDWSLAAVLPFGLDLDILLLTTGFMDLNGWHDYACKARLQAIFWDEFWAAAGVEDGADRREMQRLAEAAGRIGAVLRLAFARNADGSPAEEVLVSDSRMKQLVSWFGDA